MPRWDARHGWFGQGYRVLTPPVPTVPTGCDPGGVEDHGAFLFNMLRPRLASPKRLREGTVGVVGHSTAKRSQHVVLSLWALDDPDGVAAGVGMIIN